MKNYVSFRCRAGAGVNIVEEGKVTASLPHRLDLREHSTDFEWSYRGSGPAQLALALLADATEDDAYALCRYQDFKEDVVAGLRDGWILTDAWIQGWAAEHPLEPGEREMYEPIPDSV